MSNAPNGQSQAYWRTVDLWLLGSTIALLRCDLPGSAAPTVRSVHTGNPAFCDDSSNIEFCDAVASIATGQSCAQALAPLLAAGGTLAEPVVVPAGRPEPGLPGVVIFSDINNNAALSRRGSDVIFGLRGDGVIMVGCDLQGTEPVATFEQPAPEEPSAGAPCADVLVRGFDVIEKPQIDPVTRPHTRIWGDPHVLTTSDDVAWRTPHGSDQVCV